MELGLQGKRALVAGSSSGIGAEVGRAARLDEIASAVVLLAPKQASYITDASLRVDGGASRFVS